MAFRITVGKGHRIAACSPTPPPTFESQPAIRCLFGAERISGLEQLMHSGQFGESLAQEVHLLGYDPSKILTAGTGKVYAENVRKDLHTALRGLLVEESLQYGLASAETAFVAVRNEPGQTVVASVVVPNALPAGWATPFAHAAGVRRLMGARGTATAHFDPGDDFELCALLSCPIDSAEFCADSVMLEAAEIEAQESIALFDGVPQFEKGQAVLFDSATQTAYTRFPDGATFDQIRVAIAGTVDPTTVDPQLCLLLFVGDLVAPRVRVRLADILRAQGARPLNLNWRPDQVLRLVLSDPTGAWAQTPPQLHVELRVLGF